MAQGFVSHTLPQANSAPKGFKQGYSNPPRPGHLRRGNLGSADTGAVQHALKKGSKRITEISETTRYGVRKRIAEAIEQGMSPQEAGDYVRSWSGFDEYRAERIARTEMMNAYNTAALGTYTDYGVQLVVADDGDGDEECAARHGQTFTVDEADGIEDHPNGTLDWLPVAPDQNAADVVQELHESRPIEDVDERVNAASDKQASQPALLQLAEDVAQVAYHDYRTPPTGHELTNWDAKARLMQGNGSPGDKMLNALPKEGVKPRDADRVYNTVKQWNGSSASPGATASKVAASERRGYELSKWEQDSIQRSHEWIARQHLEYRELNTPAGDAKVQAIWEQMVRDAHSALDFHDAEIVRMGLNPDDVITVYRGIRNGDSFGLKDAAGRATDIRSGDTFDWETPGSLGSWSLDRDIAESFAKGMRGPGQKGYVLEYKVRIGDIAGLPSTNGIGTYYESEVVPYGGSARRVRVLRTYAAPR